MTDHWHGTKNKVVRYYFYIQKGLALLNELRYLIMGIFAIYMILKLDNILLMPVMFFCSLPVLISLGWLDVHHMAKIMEFLNIKYSTHYSKRNFEIQEEILEELKKINKETHEPIYAIKKLVDKETT